MIRRFLIASLFAIALLATTRIASGAQTQVVRGRYYPRGLQSYAQREAAIRQMPLLRRPDRPGHFVGNTIRRAYRSGMRYGW